MKSGEAEPRRRIKHDGLPVRQALPHCAAASRKTSILPGRCPRRKCREIVEDALYPRFFFFRRQLQVLLDS